MNIKKICGLLTALFIFFAAQTSNAEHKLANNKIGQMIMIGFRGTTVTPDHHIWQDIEKGKIGGVVLFDYDLENKKYGRNIKSPAQLKQLCSTLQDIDDSLLLIAVDQEGGKVRRLKTDTGFPELPSPSEMGKRDKKYTYQKGRETGKILSRMGINLDFAPVADVNTNPECPVIGALGRSFSENPCQVVEHCRAFISGLNQFGVAGCLKHFPGHGSSRNDSHLGLTDVTQTWQKKELIPYEKLIKSQLLFAVMTGHLFNAKLDKKYPASISRKTLHMLRQGLKCQRPIITDDLQMKAITDHFGLKTVIEKALSAGSDILLFGNNLEYEPDIASKALKIINQLLEEGKITRERLEQSVRRIQTFKKEITRVNEPSK